MDRWELTQQMRMRSLRQNKKVRRRPRIEPRETPKGRGTWKYMAREVQGRQLKNRTVSHKSWEAAFKNGIQVSNTGLVHNRLLGSVH